MEEIKRKVENILADYLKDREAFLVGIDVYPEAGILRVYVDTDLGITVDECADINRFLRDRIAEEEWAQPIRRIEVSSPGLDLPFRVFRQYKKNIGREVRVLTTKGQTINGILLYVDEEKIVIDQEGKKSEIPFLEIKETRLVLRF